MPYDLESTVAAVFRGNEMSKLLTVRYRPDVDSREQPLYTLKEAAYYIGMSSQTLSTWFCGRSYQSKAGKQRWQRVFTPADPDLKLLSFYNLAEAHVLAATRFDHKVPFWAVREAIANVVAAKPEFAIHPLLSDDFFTDGKFLFLKKLEEYVNLSSAQLPMDIIDSFLVRVLRDDIGPFKIFPLRKGEPNDKVISIAAGVSASRPIIDEVGIPVMAIYRRYRAGEDQEFIAKDFEIDLAKVRRAIEYAEHRAA
jgi:uncharacterized protein (DUF433 family)